MTRTHTGTPPSWRAQQDPQGTPNLQLLPVSTQLSPQTPLGRVQGGAATNTSCAVPHTPAGTLWWEGELLSPLGRVEHHCSPSDSLGLHVPTPEHPPELVGLPPQCSILPRSLSLDTSGTLYPMLEFLTAGRGNLSVLLCWVKHCSRTSSSSRRESSSPPPPPGLGRLLLHPQMVTSGTKPPGKPSIHLGAAEEAPHPALS